MGKGFLRTEIPFPSAIGLLIIFCCFSFQQAHANSKRMALIIANEKYLHTTTLANPGNDAVTIASKLTDLDFSVQLERDVDARRFSEIIQDFANKLDKETDVLFYYAGHGLQFRGENFLVGVDAKLKSEATLQFETFQLNSLLNILESRAGTTLLFWDACRNNPLADELARNVTSTRDSGPVGLARGGAAPLPSRRGDTLIVFSAEPGKLALDGSGKNSPFAWALSKHLSTAGVEIESMLKRVTSDVLENTEHFQRPERLSQLTRDFYFRRGQRELAYEEELKALRVKLAEVSMAPRRRVRIVSAENLGVARASIAANTTDTRDAADPVKETIGGQDVSSKDGDDTGLVVSVNPAAATTVRKIRVSPNSKLAALGDDNGKLSIIDLQTFEIVRTINAHTERISDLDFSPDSKIVLTASRDGAVRYWDIESGNKVRDLTFPGAIPYSSRMNSSFPDRWMLVGDRAGSLIAYDLKKSKIITNKKFHAGPVHSVAYKPNGGGAFLSGGGDGQLKIRLPMGQRVSIKAHLGVLFHADFSASGNIIYTVGADRKVKLWNFDKLNTESPKAVFDGHLKYVLAADLSRDEKLLASGGGDKGINLWNVETGSLEGRLEGHTGDIEAIAFTPDGKFVISASEDKSVRVWSLSSREELVRVFLKQDGNSYTGVTMDGDTFGDLNAGLISIFVGGRLVPNAEAERVVTYLGRKISIMAD